LNKFFKQEDNISLIWIKLLILFVEMREIVLKEYDDVCLFHKLKIKIEKYLKERKTENNNNK